jgi:hypothetical protein
MVHGACDIHLGANPLQMRLFRWVSSRYCLFVGQMCGVQEEAQLFVTRFLSALLLRKSIHLRSWRWKLCVGGVAVHNMTVCGTA